MSYSKEIKNKKRNLFINTFFKKSLVILFLIIFWFLFNTSIKKSISSIPVISSDYVFNSLTPKRILVSKIIELKTTIESNKVKILENNLLMEENQKLKQELGRDINLKGTLAHIKTIPNHSFYDTFIIDVGANQNIKLDQVVYAFNSVALGTIVDIQENSSTVSLFSKTNRATAAITSGSDTIITLIGRGGGEYEVRMPRDIPFEIGGLISYQSIDTAILAQIEHIATDPRDPFQRLLAKAPVNLQALKWVIVR